MSNRLLQYGIIAAGVVLIAALLNPSWHTSGGVPAEALTGGEAGAGGAVPAASGRSKAVLDVQGMTCSGCIATIKSSLVDIEGIGDVLVDVGGGRVEVFYDEARLKAVDRIASAITAAGYPATLARTLNADEIARDTSVRAARSRLFVAAVGEWEIARSDYDNELRHARARYEELYGNKVFEEAQGGELLQRLKSQVLGRLITEGIQMQEVRRSGFALPAAGLASEFEAFLSRKGMTRESFKRALEGSGYDFAYFMKKFETQATINRYVEDKVLTGITGEEEKRRHYADWFNNARLLAKVVYYDTELESVARSASGGSGCGGGCTRRQ